MDGRSRAAKGVHCFDVRWRDAPLSFFPFAPFYTILVEINVVWSFSERDRWAVCEGIQKLENVGVTHHLESEPDSKTINVFFCENRKQRRGMFKSRVWMPCHAMLLCFVFGVWFVGKPLNIRSFGASFVLLWSAPGKDQGCVWVWTRA